MVYSGGYLHKNFKLGGQKYKNCKQILQNFVKRKNIIKNFFTPLRLTGPLPISALVAYCINAMTPLVLHGLPSSLITHKPLIMTGSSVAPL